MKGILGLGLLILLPVSALGSDREWAITVREAVAEGPALHMKFEYEDDEAWLQNLDTREEFELDSKSRPVQMALELIETYVHNTRIEMPDKDYDEFLEVEFEYEEENKGIELELTFDQGSVPEDIRTLIDTLFR